MHSSVLFFCFCCLSKFDKMFSYIISQRDDECFSNKHYLSHHLFIGVVTFIYWIKFLRYEGNKKKRINLEKIFKTKI